MPAPVPTLASQRHSEPAAGVRCGTGSVGAELCPSPPDPQPHGGVGCGVKLTREGKLLPDFNEL